MKPAWRQTESTLWPRRVILLLCLAVAATARCPAGMMPTGVRGIHLLDDRTMILEYDPLDPYNFSVYDLQSGTVLSDVNLCSHLEAAWFVGVRVYDDQQVLVALSAGAEWDPDTLISRMLTYDVSTRRASVFLDLEGERLVDFAVTEQHVVVALEGGLVRTYPRERGASALHETQVEIPEDGRLEVCADGIHDLFAVFGREQLAAFYRTSSLELLFTLSSTERWWGVRDIEFTDDGILVLTGRLLRLVDYEGTVKVSHQLPDYYDYVASGSPGTHCVATFDGLIAMYGSELDPVETRLVPDDLVVMCLARIGAGRVAAGLGELVPIAGTFERPASELVLIVETH
jgi:hypothetical protein